MALTVHLLVGAAFGAPSHNIFISFLAGYISHYLVDSFPHWDYLKRVDHKKSGHILKIGLDLLIGLGLVLILSWDKPFLIYALIGALAAGLADFFELLYRNFNFRILRPFSWLHSLTHYKKKGPKLEMKELFFMLLIPAIAVFFLLIF